MVEFKAKCSYCDDNLKHNLPEQFGGKRRGCDKCVDGYVTVTNR